MSKNVKLAIILGGVGLTMLAMGYAFVPLYRIFCQTFGIPVPSVAVGQAGTPKQLGEVNTEREITVRFMGTSANGIPVKLWPVERKVKLHLNEPTLVAYKGFNPLDEPFKGVAVHMIGGLGRGKGIDMAQYIDLQQCFCFEEQIYPPKQEVNLPLSFFVTDDLPEDIHTVTFMYTLFEADEEHLPGQS